MSANAKLWLVAVGASLVGALLGAGLVWASQQATVGSLNARIIRIEADNQAATHKAGDLQTELDALKASAPASTNATGGTAGTPTSSANPPKTPSKTVKQFTYVTAISGPATKPVITADFAQLLSGDAAAAAATAHGDESPPPNDYYIVNDNKRLRKLPVKTGIKVTVTTNSDGTSDPNGHIESFAQWASNYAAPTAENEGVRSSPYWITVKDGTVIKIVQQYLP